MLSNLRFVQHVADDGIAKLVYHRALISPPPPLPALGYKPEHNIEYKDNTRDQTALNKPVNQCVLRYATKDVHDANNRCEQRVKCHYNE